MRFFVCILAQGASEGPIRMRVQFDDDLPVNPIRSRPVALTNVVNAQQSHATGGAVDAVGDTIEAYRFTVEVHLE